MVNMRQPQQENWWTKISALMRFVAKLPLIALVIVATAMASWLAFWFIIRLCVFCYTTWLSEPWN